MEIAHKSFKGRVGNRTQKKKRKEEIYGEKGSPFCLLGSSPPSIPTAALPWRGRGWGWLPYQFCTRRRGRNQGLGVGVGPCRRRSTRVNLAKTKKPKLSFLACYEKTFKFISKRKRVGRCCANTFLYFARKIRSGPRVEVIRPTHRDTRPLSPRRVRSRIRYDLGNVSSMCGKEEMDKRPRISPWITDPHIGSPLSLVLGTTYTYSM